MDIIQGEQPLPNRSAPSLQAVDYALQAWQLYKATDPYLRPIRQTFFQLQAKTYPIILPYLNRAATLAQDSPALLTVGVLMLFLLIAMQILFFVRRVMMFWMRLVTRLVFWGAIAVLISVVVQRGVGRTAQDLVGWGQELSQVWSSEYKRWEGYQNMNQKKPGQGFGGSKAKSNWR